MMQQPDPWDVDISANLGEFALAPPFLDRLESILKDVAPRWAKRARVMGAPKGANRSMSAQLHDAAFARGALYRELVAIHRPPRALDRQFGTAELAGPGLSVIVGGDEFLLHPQGKGWQWGNHVALQLHAVSIEGEPGFEWADRCIRNLCSQFRVEYAVAGALEEHHESNLENTSSIVRAIGVNPVVALPGVFWRNYFGPRYVDFIGRKRFAAISELTVPIGSGLLVAIDMPPDAWATTEYQSVRSSIRDALGRDLFFDRHAEPSFVYRAPDFSVESGPPRVPA